ncbi:Hsp20 family protein [Lutibaculum baratangense]|uniref:Small heat shock protein n=1 Tax=Lutibaculum baratangense AMV1 TaxID=631454 RepID=V4RS07_9HYPH|nr:Hsp20 family protein [Lutibaculum baratangense]ESR25905.1 Small heat shock protein [Lutibaculum baratangense AMV1]
MSRVPSFNSPFLVGFDGLERLLDRAVRNAGDGYPPYNIERIRGEGESDRLRITLAVAGFSSSELEVTLEDNQLTIRGRQAEEEGEREFLHRGIAARQFQRSFVLAEGMEVDQASLNNGLLVVDLVRPEPQRIVKRIDITTPTSVAGSSQ